MPFIEKYLADAVTIVRSLDTAAIERVLALLVALRDRGGRLFILGVGGSAANASHAVNDFRKIAGIEAYSPVDNVSELTARVNDDGWASVFAGWLETSRVGTDDMVMVLSVGGGDREKNVSPNIVEALRYARARGATVTGIVGRDGGETARVADACVVVPVVDPGTVTAHTESFQPLVWHLLVSHPALRRGAMTWESLGDARPRSQVLRDAARLDTP
jgi:D-sedoheptulose 7-phosphate isomerase